MRIDLSEITLAVVLLYSWLISIRTRAIRDDLRTLVDRTDLRDLKNIRIRTRKEKPG